MVAFSDRVACFDKTLLSSRITVAKSDKGAEFGRTPVIAPTGASGDRAGDKAMIKKKKKKTQMLDQRPDPTQSGQAENLNSYAN